MEESDEKDHFQLTSRRGLEVQKGRITLIDNVIHGDHNRDVVHELRFKTRFSKPIVLQNVFA